MLVNRLISNWLIWLLFYLLCSLLVRCRLICVLGYDVYILLMVLLYSCFIFWLLKFVGRKLFRCVCVKMSRLLIICCMCIVLCWMNVIVCMLCEDRLLLCSSVFVEVRIVLSGECRLCVSILVNRLCMCLVCWVCWCIDFVSIWLMVLLNWIIFCSVSV